MRAIAQDDFDLAVEAQATADSAVTNLVTKLRAGALVPQGSDIASLYVRWAFLERRSSHSLSRADVRLYREHIAEARQFLRADYRVWLALAFLYLRAITLPYPLAGVRHEVFILVYLRDALIRGGAVN